MKKQGRGRNDMSINNNRNHHHHQLHSYPQSVHNPLYHSHLRLSSAHPQASSPPNITTTTSTSTSSSTNPTTAMVPHIANLASDEIHVQTASTVQYHRAHLPAPCTVAIACGPSQSPRPMRHLRHPSNLPLYTTIPEPDTHKGNRRLRDSLRPLFHIFSPNTNDSPSSPTPPDKPLDDSRKVGSKARVLRETSVNIPPNHHHPDQHRQAITSRGRSNSTKSTCTNSHHTTPLTPPSSAGRSRPTRYFRREQSRDAVLEELKCEGLLGAGKPPSSFSTSSSSSSSSSKARTATATTPKTTTTTTNKKRKGRSDESPPDLSKPLPPLVPDMLMRTREERYWAGVAEDIARRASMLS